MKGIQKVQAICT